MCSAKTKKINKNLELLFRIFKIKNQPSLTLLGIPNSPDKFRARGKIQSSQTSDMIVSEYRTEIKTNTLLNQKS